MGQGVSAMAIVGIWSNVLAGGALTWTGRGSVMLGAVVSGLAIDVASDATARVGKIDVPRAVVLSANDDLRFAYTFYATNEAHRFAKLVRQKHEWVVLESHTHKFYTVQKTPTGDVTIGLTNSLRRANDLGLAAAQRPLSMGETQSFRADMHFDLPDDLQVAYVIAWLRKEDPRWAFSTENSKHFTTRLRYALNDF
jgi:hypothetical protein